METASPRWSTGPWTPGFSEETTERDKPRILRSFLEGDLPSRVDPLDSYPFCTVFLSMELNLFLAVLYLILKFNLIVRDILLCSLAACLSLPLIFVVLLFLFAFFALIQH
jgi:hypothetical protein